MANRGLGEKQIESEKAAKQKIMTILRDNQPHRFNEIQEKTKLSTSTLSKHLKELCQGIVERNVDTETKIYPPPVYYKIRFPDLEPESIVQPVQILTDYIDGVKHHDYSEIAEFLDRVNEHFSLELLTILRHRFSHKIKEDPQLRITEEKIYSQNLENLLIPNLTLWVSDLKQKLEELEQDGVNVPALLDDAFKRNIDDFTQKAEQISKRQQK